MTVVKQVAVSIAVAVITVAVAEYVAWVEARRIAVNVAKLPELLGGQH